MIWDKSTALRIFFVLVVSVFVPGCAAIVHNTESNFETAVDLSDANDVAIIKGVYTSAMAGYMSEDCWILEPGNAKQITVNAGVVNFTAACEGFDFFDTSNSVVDSHYLSFRFVALAGHEYAIKRYRGTFRLHDETAKQKLKHCAKSKTHTCYTNHGSKDGRSPGANRALIMAGGATSNKGGCKPALKENVLGMNAIYVDAGAITTYARCFDVFFGRPASVATFNFVAEGGHEYTFAASDEECIHLIDITDSDITNAEIVLACEPYKEAE
jgi:hypothetical protein